MTPPSPGFGVTSEARAYAPEATQVRNSVVLAEWEITWIRQVGAARRAYGREQGWGRGKGPSAACEDATYDERGVLAEYGASLVLNRFFRPHIGELDQLDVGGLFEVRSIEDRHYQLIVKPTLRGKPIPPLTLYVLALLEGARVSLLGWCFAGEAMRRPITIGRGDPAHYVPQKDLHPIDALRVWLRTQ